MPSSPHIGQAIDRDGFRAEFQFVLPGNGRNTICSRDPQDGQKTHSHGRAITGSVAEPGRGPTSGRIRLRRQGETICRYSLF